MLPSGGVVGRLQRSRECPIPFVRRFVVPSIDRLSFTLSSYTSIPYSIQYDAAGLSSILARSWGRGAARDQVRLHLVAVSAALLADLTTHNIVVGIYDDGVNVPSPHALFLAVCASTPDTLGEKPMDSRHEYVPIAVVGEVPVLLRYLLDEASSCHPDICMTMNSYACSNAEDIEKFAFGGVNRFVCVNPGKPSEHTTNTCLLGAH